MIRENGPWCERSRSPLPKDGFPSSSLDARKDRLLSCGRWRGPEDLYPRTASSRRKLRGTRCLLPTVRQYSNVRSGHERHILLRVQSSFLRRRNRLRTEGESVQGEFDGNTGGVDRIVIGNRELHARVYI